MKPEKADSLRLKIRFYLLDTKTPAGKFIDISIILLNLLVCFLYVLTTYSFPQSVQTALWRIEMFIVGLFVIEYFARLYGAEKRLKHIFNIYSIIDLIAILPGLSEMILPIFGLSMDIAFVHTLRAFRVFRIFRFLRFTADPIFFFGKIRMSALRIMRLILTILIIFFISSGLFYQVEYQSNPGVRNFGDAFYYTVVTLTTVGFGDIVPLSAGGRWVTVLMILSGIIMIPWEASQVVKEWMNLYNKKTDVICGNCGLRGHDSDATHCKACGQVIFQEFSG